MSKKIDSDIMKSAVEQLFNHEVEQNGKVSSHSQLERWIIEELKSYRPSDTVLALTMCLRSMRGIELNMGDVDDDTELLRAMYANHNMYTADTGGNSVAFRYDNQKNSNYALVTIEDGLDIPASLHEPIQFGLYNEDDDILYQNWFKTSIHMFEDKLITYILSC